MCATRKKGEGGTERLFGKKKRELLRTFPAPKGPAPKAQWGGKTGHKCSNRQERSRISLQDEGGRPANHGRSSMKDRFSLAQGEKERILKGGGGKKRGKGKWIDAVRARKKKREESTWK